jgi:3-oxoadipate enol-lactonase
MAFLTLNGARIAYSDTGPPSSNPEAPTAFFGHGMLFSGWMFTAQIAELRAHYRCVTIDWRGQGDSPPAAGGYDMDTLTTDAVSLIEHLGVAPVHYVGLSMGGFVGQRLAARHPELVRSLVLLDTSAELDEPSGTRQDKVLAAIIRIFGFWPVKRPLMKGMFGPTFLADPQSKPIVAEWARRVSRCDRSGTRQAALGVINRRAVLDEIGTIRAPTLVVVGEHDTATPPERSRTIAAAIPGARLEIVLNSGHSSTVEQPAALTDLIRSFINDVDQAEPGGTIGGVP